MNNYTRPISETNQEAIIKILLTSREEQVLGLLAQGYNDNGIGKELFISPWTVKSHRKNLLKKYNARNSCHLIFMAYGAQHNVESITF